MLRKNLAKKLYTNQALPFSAYFFCGGLYILWDIECFAMHFHWDSQVLVNADWIWEEVRRPLFRNLEVVYIILYPLVVRALVAMLEPDSIITSYCTSVLQSVCKCVWPLKVLQLRYGRCAHILCWAVPQNSRLCENFFVEKAALLESCYAYQFLLVCSKSVLEFPKDRPASISLRLLVTKQSVSITLYKRWYEGASTMR